MPKLLKHDGSLSCVLLLCGSARHSRIDEVIPSLVHVMFDQQARASREDNDRVGTLWKSIPWHGALARLAQCINARATWCTTSLISIRSS